MKKCIPLYSPVLLYESGVVGGSDLHGYVILMKIQENISRL